MKHHPARSLLRCPPSHYPFTQKEIKQNETKKKKQNKLSDTISLVLGGPGGSHDKSPDQIHFGGCTPVNLVFTVRPPELLPPSRSATDCPRPRGREATPPPRSLSPRAPKQIALTPLPLFARRQTLVDFVADHPPLNYSSPMPPSQL
jgi:hypothetical protein